MKIRPVRAELFHADGWTDTTDRRSKANRRFLQFCEHTKNTKCNYSNAFYMLEILRYQSFSHCCKSIAATALCIHLIFDPITVSVKN